MAGARTAGQSPCSPKTSANQSTISKAGSALARLARDIGLAHRPIVPEGEECKEFDLEIAAGRLHSMRERRSRSWIKRDEVGLFAGFDRADAIVETERPGVAERHAVDRVERRP